MASLRTYALCVLTSLAFVAPVNGEAATAVVEPVGGGDGIITVPGTVTPGSECEVNYCNPELAGTTVTVTVHDGMGGDPDTVEIDLDEEGCGIGKWEVKNWESGAAIFEEPNARMASATIL